jgi:hypothetical protein
LGISPPIFQNSAVVFPILESAFVFSVSGESPSEMEIDFLFLAGAGYCSSLPLAMLLDALK